jgi:hypothetical protein
VSSRFRYENKGVREVRATRDPSADSCTTLLVHRLNTLTEHDSKQTVPCQILQCARCLSVCHCVVVYEIYLFIYLGEGRGKRVICLTVKVV